MKNWGHQLPSSEGARRVLIISQWFDPEPTFKGLMFAKALRDQGFEVSVLTGFPNYPGGKLYDGYRVRLFKREKIDGVDVLRVPLYPSHDGSGLRRAANYLSFAMSASIASLIIRRPSVAYVYHPPATVGLVAQSLKYLRGVPYVYDVQDLWPDTLAATGMLRNSRILAAVGKYMKSVYRSATAVVVLSPGFRNALEMRGIPQEKLEVIPNWTYEPERKESVARVPQAEFVVVYAGNIGAAQDLRVVIDAAEELACKAVRFDIVGDGLEFDALKREAELRNLRQVNFLGRRPTIEMDAIFEGADALLVHLREDPLFEITIPSKTQAYLRAGRPILMGVKGDAAALVVEAGAGVTFEPGSGPALARATLRLMSMPTAELERMGRSGRAYYERTLSLGVGAKRFADLFDEAMLHRPRYRVAKRLLDIFGAIAGLAISLIPMLVIATVIKIGIGGPVLFVQERPGQNGETFRMVKFRTMTNRTDAEGNLLPDRERLTALGRALRASSLDELPELWNVLKGDMSLVGPRPLLMRYSAYFTSRERLRLRVRPGITGWAQINGRNTTSWDQRLEYDAWYVEHQSFWLDLRIVARTISRVLRSDGVVVDAESVMQNLDDERSGSVVE